MHKPSFYPVKKMEYNTDCSFSTAVDKGNDRNILLQKIELLEMENSELRKRQEYLKMVNSTLLEALGNKEGLKQIITKATNEQYYQSEPCDDTRSNQMNSFKKKIQERKLEINDDHKESIDTIYETGDIDTHSNYKYGQTFDDEYYGFQKQKMFGKTKDSQFCQRKEINQLFKNRSSTPKIENRSNFNKKSSNNLTALFNETSSSKHNRYITGSSQSRKSQVSSISNTLGKNVATALFCDLCNMSYSPLEFITHAQQCQANHEEQSQLMKIGNKSFQQDESESDEEQLLETLEEEKNALMQQINRLKRNRNTPDRKLQRNLDQIVFIINNKKSLNEKDIKTLLKEKNAYTSLTTKRR